MGPIQTAIGQAMGAIGGAAILGKKMQENGEKTKGQAAEKKQDKGAATSKNIVLSKADENTEKGQKMSSASKALKTAQDKKIDSPRQIYFWGQDPEPLATSSELASVLANVSLQNATSSKSRSRNKVRERKQALMKRKLARRD